MSREEQLERALSWILTNGVRVHFHDNEISFDDYGCGCCSYSMECPSEHVEIITEVIKKVNTP